MAKRKIGPFILERKLGVGGMGIVYLATYEKTGRKVAVKVLSPAMSDQPQVLKRFEREMDILKKLKDPHVVQYFGGGKQRGQHFYAMELVDGGTLEEVIKERAPLDWEFVVDCGIQICSGLEKAHAMGIIHRDLKPANLFLSTKTGELKLGDFGIARDTTATALTAAGRTVGTYAYMAPEQIIGKPPVSRKTDLYSLGCVLFEMLTGHTPFQADTAAAMLMMHLDEDPPKVRGKNMQCPIWLENLIQRLLAKDPGDRPFDAQATRLALEEVRNKEATQMSVSTQAARGAGTGGTTVSMDSVDPELKKILQKKKKQRKRKKDQPFHEQTWFLVLCLVMVIGVTIWLLLPDSAETMYEKANAYLAQEDEGGLFYGREQLQKLIESYPDHNLAEIAQKKVDQLDMDKALQESTKAARTGLPVQLAGNEARTRFVEALRFELYGDRATALEKYQSLRNLFEINQDVKEEKFNSRSYQIYLKLTRLKIDEIQQQIADGTFISDPQILILQNMREADQLLARGETFKAKQKWNSLLELYSENKEYAAQMNYIMKRKEGAEIAPWDYSPLDNLKKEAEENSAEENPGNN
ncbi:Serine/threonine-protein kinase PknL [Polystyrenella longa]|uniref:Serine/threonine-protein kinase PknL n=1 Tax=Polystyrenella longa TaxID=2528007 RepID=A0A518CKK4_9PLAN|nr:serine/threonine-protein kinase [Polystyrenella longa]QDU79751.1 Serine/threonine-protein kinase PknL [Polystyrenella longa]